MKSLVIYDSMFGNTEKVAREIGKVLQVKVKPVNKVEAEEIGKAELVVLGTPVHGGRVSEPMQEWLSNLPKEIWKKKKVAVFDTRFDEARVNFGLKVLMKTIGYAAPKLTKQLQAAGAEVVCDPEGFIVTGKEGPLAELELSRASVWANDLMKKRQV